MTEMKGCRRLCRLIRTLASCSNWKVSFEVILMFFSTLTAVLLTQTLASASTLPRTADGKPSLQGIWQVRNRASYDLQDHAARHGMPAEAGVVEGGEIPYQSWASARKQQNYANRETADPLSKCYMPGVPRIKIGRASCRERG